MVLCLIEKKTIPREADATEAYLLNVKIKLFNFFFRQTLIMDLCIKRDCSVLTVYLTNKKTK